MFDWCCKAEVQAIEKGTLQTASIPVDAEGLQTEAARV